MPGVNPSLAVSESVSNEDRNSAKFSWLKFIAAFLDGAETENGPGPPAFIDPVTVVVTEPGRVAFSLLGAYGPKDAYDVEVDMGIAAILGAKS